MASIQGIYLALFGRPADPAGLAYWNEQSKNGADLSKIIDVMTKAPEAVARFSGLSDAALVTGIYQALFDRLPDAAGLAFFTEQLKSGKQTVGSLAINILDGAGGNDLILVQNREKAANAFTASLDTPAEIAAYNGSAAADFGRSFVKTVTTDPASIPTAAQVQASINTSLPGASSGQAPAGGNAPAAGGNTGNGNTGGDTSTPAPTAASLSADKTLTISANADATVTIVNGSYQISSNGFSSTTVAATDVSKIIIGSGAKLSIAGTELAAKAFAVSGPGTLNATGVTFVESNGNTAFEASSEFDPRLIKAQFLVNNNRADAFKAMWDYVDDHYSYYNIPINQAGVELGISYLKYLKGGGDPLTDVIAKTNSPGRVQSMHDNLLGNLDELSIKDKFKADPALRDKLLGDVSDAGASGRPINGGYTQDQANGAAGDQARQWDYANGLKRTDFIEKNKDASVDASASSNGKLFVGSGNSADHFNVVRHEGAGVELALKAKVRGGTDYTSSSPDEFGVVKYDQVKAGSQNVNWGGQPSKASDWSFDFSVATGLNGSTKSLDDFKFRLSIDVDPTDQVKMLVLDLKNNNGAMQWVSSVDGNAVVINDDDTSATKLSQNSVNIGFQKIFEKIDGDATAPGIQAYDFNRGGVFDVTLQALTADNAVLVTNHIRIDADPLNLV